MSVLIGEIYSGSALMADSTMIGTAKEIIQFGILVFLETQEINLRANLQDSKCDILHIFMRTSFLRKSYFPIVDSVFFSYHFTPGPGNVLRNWPFFSNATTLQIRLSLQQTQTSRKFFPFESSAIVGSLPEKGL